MFESRSESTAVTSWQSEKGRRHCLESYLPEEQRGEWKVLCNSYQIFLFLPVYPRAYKSQDSLKVLQTLLFLDLRHYLWIASGPSSVDYGKPKTGDDDSGTQE